MESPSSQLDFSEQEPQDSSWLSQNIYIICVDRVNSRASELKSVFKIAPVCANDAQVLQPACS